MQIIYFLKLDFLFLTILNSRVLGICLASRFHWQEKKSASTANQLIFISDILKTDNLHNILI